MSDTLQKITIEIGKAFLPLNDAFSSVEALESFLEELGWDGSAIVSMPTSVADVVDGVSEMVVLFNDIFSNNEPSTEQIRSLMRGIKRLVNALDNINTSTGLPPNLIEAGFHSAFPRQILDYLPYRVHSSR